MNTLPYPLNLVGWQGSQVIEHAKTLVGTVNTPSLNSTAEEVGSTLYLVCIFNSFLIFSYLDEPSACIKVRIHFYLLCRSIPTVC